jgi:hypothetical protein
MCSTHFAQHPQVGDLKTSTDVCVFCACADSAGGTQSTRAVMITKSLCFTLPLYGSGHGERQGYFW